MSDWEDSFQPDNQTTGATPALDPQDWSASFQATGVQPQGQPNTVAPVSFLQSVGQGVIDPMNAGAQMLLHALPDKGILKGSAQYLDDQLQANDAQYQAGRQAAGRDGIDWGRGLGNVAAMLPVAEALPSFAGSSVAARGAGLLGNGAVFGSLQPVETPVDDFADAKMAQAATGSITNGIFGVLGNGVQRIISPNVSPDIQTLINNGITPTIGQTLGGVGQAIENKATSVPILGDMIKRAQGRAADDLNQAVYNRALAPIGESVTADSGREAVAQVKDKLGQAYNDLLPNMSFTPDAQFAQDLGNIRQQVSILPEEQQNKFNNIVNTQITSKLSANGGTLGGNDLKGVESELQRLAKGYKTDSSFDNRQMGDALDGVLTSFRNGLSRSNPQYASQLANINQGYANYAILRRAASATGASDGVFSAAQLQNAVKANDSSVGKGAFASGQAKMQDLSDAAKNVLGNIYPDSGTAGREGQGILMGALLGGGEGAGAMLGHPLVLPSIAAAAAPYTKIGQNLFSKALTQRPSYAPAAANAVGALTPYLGAGATPLGAQLLPFALNGGAQ